MALSLRDQLKSYATNAGSASALVESETNIRLELLKSQKKVEHFETILAVSSEHKDGDAAAMSQKVAQQQERIKVLEASCKAAEAVSAHSFHLNSALRGYVDRIIGSWS